MATKSIIVNKPINEVYDRIRTIRGYKLNKANPNTYTIVLSTGITLTNWGMAYPISMIELSAVQTQVNVGVNPVSPLQFNQAYLQKKCVEDIVNLLNH